MDQKNNSSLNEYEIEIPESKGFFASLIDRFKRNSSQKLLNSGNSQKTHTTSRSISSMWEMGSFRASFFSALESVRASIFKSKTPEVKNGFATEIIGENANSKDLDFSEQDTPFKDPEKKVIIPSAKNFQMQQPKNIINNARSAEDLEEDLKIESNEETIDEITDSKETTENNSSTIEVATIDTSGIEKTKEKEMDNNHQNRLFATKIDTQNSKTEHDTR